MQRVPVYTTWLLLIPELGQYYFREHFSALMHFDVL